MKYYLLKSQNSIIPYQKFFDFWMHRYFYKSKHDYDKLMDQELTEEALKALFEWKNGMNLSKKKEASYIAKVKNHLKSIAEYRNDTNKNASQLYDSLNNVSFVWRIFACHIARPQEYPIYDQNIHRSVLYIQGNDEWKNVTPQLSDEKKEDFYFHNYKEKFLPEFKDIPSRDIDKALFAFGRYLRDYERHAES